MNLNFFKKINFDFVFEIYSVYRISRRNSRSSRRIRLRTNRPISIHTHSQLIYSYKKPIVKNKFQYTFWCVWNIFLWMLFTWSVIQQVMSYFCQLIITQSMITGILQQNHNFEILKSNWNLQKSVKLQLNTVLELSLSSLDRTFSFSFSSGNIFASSVISSIFGSTTN